RGAKRHWCDRFGRRRKLDACVEADKSADQWKELAHSRVNHTGKAKSSIQNQNARIKAELFIDGKWVEGEGLEPFSVLNPFDNSEICKIRPESAAQGNQAVEAADAAFRRPDWRKLTGRERGKLLLCCWPSLAETRWWSSPRWWQRQIDL